MLFGFSDEIKKMIHSNLIIFLNQNRESTMKNILSMLTILV